MIATTRCTRPKPATGSVTRSAEPLQTASSSPQTTSPGGSPELPHLSWQDHPLPVTEVESVGSNIPGSSSPAIVLLLLLLLLPHSAAAAATGSCRRAMRFQLKYTAVVPVLVTRSTALPAAAAAAGTIPSCTGCCPNCCCCCWLCLSTACCSRWRRHQFIRLGAVTSAAGALRCYEMRQRQLLRVLLQAWALHLQQQHATTPAAAFLGVSSKDPAHLALDCSSPRNPSSYQQGGA